jgi:uncharacterized membrane protein
MNAHGDVVGGSAGYVVVWRDGQPTVLPRLNPQDFCGGYAINDVGVVAGWCYTGQSSHSIPVAWVDDVPRALWGNPQSTDTAFARALNNVGEVVGVQRATPLLWRLDGKKPTRLAPAGASNGINDDGISVGLVGLNGGEGTDTPRATKWLPGGVSVDLGTLPGGGLSFARAINGAGVATGMVADANTGLVHPVLFLP